ncbi:MAG: hypothetical protein ACFB10_11500 [Salibacteraceae bacterium]
MKFLSITLLLIAGLFTAQAAQAQGVQIVNSSTCTVTFSFTWSSSIPFCTGPTTTSSQVMGPNSNLLLPSPSPGAKVTMFRVDYPGLAPIMIPSFYCNNGLAGGSINTTGCGTWPPGFVSWNDNAPHLFAPQIVEAH